MNKRHPFAPALLAGIAVLLLAGCTDIKPGGVMHRSKVTGPEVSAHADLDDVLQRLVDSEGFVDYRELVRETGTLDRYYHWLNTTSPDSDPALFPTTADELAYWINAYNASVLIIVVEYYPIDSVEDVRTPFPLWLVSDKAGFFVLQRINLGGETMSLHGLEDEIRDRYDEPRIHFAINCASRGCPPLPREAFVGKKLDAQLDRQARRFFAAERNLRIDHQARVVELSSILDWYEDDFTDWYEAQHPGTKATLLDYAALYTPAEKAADLRTAAEQDYEIVFVPYDWSLNVQPAS
jgi:hypothetical protein